MSLLTDSDFLGLADLASVDPAVPEVSADESITVEGDGGIIREAWEEMTGFLLEKMDSFGGLVYPLGALYSAGLGTVTTRVFLTQIVASDQYARRHSLVERWMLYHALEMFYRAAAHRSEVDRYEVKRGQFAEYKQTHWRTLMSRGLPIVQEPLPAPGSLHERNSGSWSGSNVGSLAGGSAAAATYQVAVTWVDQSRYLSSSAKGNAESGPSEIIGYNLPENEVLRVDIGTLIPPTGGVRRFAEGVLGTLAATGWNLYAGLPGGELYLQNAAPIPVATTVYTLAGAPQLSGAALDSGQTPDANYSFQNMLQRA